MDARLAPASHSNYCEGRWGLGTLGLCAETVVTIKQEKKKENTCTGGENNQAEGEGKNQLVLLQHKSPPPLERNKSQSEMKVNARGLSTTLLSVF